MPIGLIAFGAVVIAIIFGILPFDKLLSPREQIFVMGFSPIIVAMFFVPSFMVGKYEITIGILALLLGIILLCLISVFKSTARLILTIFYTLALQMVVFIAINQNTELYFTYYFYAVAIIIPILVALDRTDFKAKLLALTISTTAFYFISFSASVSEGVWLTDYILLSISILAVCESIAAISIKKPSSKKYAVKKS